MATASLRGLTVPLALIYVAMGVLWGSASPAASTSYSLKILDNPVASDPSFDSSGNVTTYGNGGDHLTSGPYTINGSAAIPVPPSHDTFNYISEYGTNGVPNQAIYPLSSGYSETQLFQVNNKGVAVGSENNGGQINNGWFGQAIIVGPKSGASLLPTLAGSAGVAYAINDVGTIVGASGLPGGGGQVAFISDGQKATDLNTLIAASSGYTLVSATDINDVGQITGYATKSDGSFNEYAYLLTPTATPEPSALALLAAASAFAAARKLARTRKLARGEG